MKLETTVMRLDYKTLDHNYIIKVSNEYETSLHETESTIEDLWKAGKKS